MNSIVPEKVPGSKAITLEERMVYSFLRTMMYAPQLWTFFLKLVYLDG